MTQPWTPLKNFLNAKMVKAFLPRDKHPELPLVYSNLYPGDSVYVFETSGRWGRAYVAKLPFPHEFSATAVDLDRLPEPTITVAIIPLSHMKLIEEIPVESNDQVFLSTTSQAAVPLPHDEDTTRKSRPPLPILRVDQSDLPSEISAAILSLNNHIYALYAMGEFTLFHKLTHLYVELDELRIKITYTLCTGAEMAAAFKHAAVILGKVSKLLGLRDLPSTSNNFTANLDTQGYEAILLRDADTGEMFDRARRPTPSLVAANQLLFALTPNYPITAAIEPSLAPLRSRLTLKVPASHILVDFKDVDGEHHLTPAGFSGMTAYLYLRSQKKRLTEAFAIHVDPSHQFSLGNLSAALFKNIPASEIDTGRIYLVAVLTEDLVVNKTLRTIKQGIAAGVTDISRIFSRHKGALASGEAHTFNIRLYGLHFSGDGGAGLDANYGWGELVDRIIAGSNRGIAINPRARKLAVSVKEFKTGLVGDDYEVTRTKLNLVGEAILSNPIAPIRSFAYDPLGRNYERVYMRVGKVQVFGDAPADAFVTLEISTANRHVTFAKGTNQKPEQTWRFVLTRAGEAVGEIIKINGLESLPGPDERVKLTCYVNGDIHGTNTLKIKHGGRVATLEGMVVEMHLSTGQATASVELYTEYVGKQYNMEPAVAALLQPESADVAAVQSLLATQFRRLAVAAYVRHFPELVAALLRLLARGHDEGSAALQHEAFRALVHLLDVVVARQDQYHYLFDAFAERPPPLPMVGHRLCALAGEVFSRAALEWTAVGRALCRVLAWLCQVAVLATGPAAAPVFVENTKVMLWACNQFLEQPREDLIADQVLVLGVLDACFSTFAEYFPRLRVAYLVQQTADALGTRGLGAHNAVLPTTGKRLREHALVVAKMLFLRRLLDLWVMETEECRNILLVDALEWAVQVLVASVVDVDAARLAHSVVARIFLVVWAEVVVPGDRAGDFLCYGIVRLLPALARSFIKYEAHCRAHGLLEPRRTFTQLFPKEHPFVEITMDLMVNAEVFAEVLMELAALVAFCAQIGASVAGDAGFVDVFANIAPEAEVFTAPHYTRRFTDDDILVLFTTVEHFAQARFFPCRKWLLFHAVLAAAGVTVFELLKRKMLKYYVPAVAAADTFNDALWGAYLRTMFLIGHLMPVSICHLAEIPRKGCWKITGDVRARVAALVADCWTALGWPALSEDRARFRLLRVGGYQAAFVATTNGFLPDLMFYALQRHTRLQALGVEVLWSLMVAELLVSDNLAAFEKECIVSLHDIYHTATYKPLRYELRNLIRLLRAQPLDAEDVAYPVMQAFVNALAEFLELLDQLHNVPLGAEFDDDRTAHKLNVKGLLMNVDRPELLQQYIHEMYQTNLGKGNHVQAALALKLLADTLEWSVHVALPASTAPDFPAQSAFQRKEALYTTIAHNYVQGNRHEKALEIYLELCEAHNAHTLDLKALAAIHARLARVYADVEALDRLAPSYFRIAFIGAGFPRSIRNRQYVYEGLPFEHVSSIHQRLLKIHPGARVVTSDEDARGGAALTGRFLHITTLEPARDPSATFYSLGHKRFAENKDLKFFTVKKRIPGSTSVVDFWSEETTFETERTFPTLMNRSVIVNAAVVRLSPLDNALRSFADKIADLRSVHELVRTTLDDGGDAAAVFGELSRQCSGTIDSPVNGGVHQYKLFFQNVDDFSYQHELLKRSFLDLTIILSRLLVLHGKLAPPPLKASHHSLVELFNKNFKDELDELRADKSYDGGEFKDRVADRMVDQSSLGAPSIGYSTTRSMISGTSDHSGPQRYLR